MGLRSPFLPGYKPLGGVLGEEDDEPYLGPEEGADFTQPSPLIPQPKPPMGEALIGQALGPQGQPQGQVSLQPEEEIEFEEEGAPEEEVFEGGTSKPPKPLSDAELLRNWATKRIGRKDTLEARDELRDSQRERNSIAAMFGAAAQVGYIPGQPGYKSMMGEWASNQNRVDDKAIADLENASDSAASEEKSSLEALLRANSAETAAADRASNQEWLGKTRGRQEGAWAREDADIAREAGDMDPNSPQSIEARAMLETAFMGRPQVLALIKGKSKADLEKSPTLKTALGQILGDEARAKADAERLRAERRADAKAKEGQGEKINPIDLDAQRKMNSENVKDLTEWRKTREIALTNIKNLEAALAKLPTLKGKMDWGKMASRSDMLMSPSGINMRDTIWKTAFSALKATLGAQFTQAEGDRIMSASYNPMLSPEENIPRVKDAIRELKARFEQMDSLVKYWDKNQSFRGYVPPSAGVEPVKGDSTVNLSGAPKVEQTAAQSAPSAPTSGGAAIADDGIEVWKP